MSDLSAYIDLNQAELIARIERQQVETRKFAEQAIKLAAEPRKLGRDGSTPPRRPPRRQ